MQQPQLQEYSFKKEIFHLFKKKPHLFFYQKGKRELKKMNAIDREKFEINR